MRNPRWITGVALGLVFGLVGSALALSSTDLDNAEHDATYGKKTKILYPLGAHSAVQVEGVASGVAVPVSGTVTVTAPLAVTDNSGSLTVDSPQLPAALAAGGGLKVEGIVGGVAQPVTSTQLPSALISDRLDVRLGATGINLPVTDAGGSLTVDDGLSSLTVDQGEGWGFATTSWNVRLSDGANYYDGAKTGQLPTALGSQGALKVEGVASGTPVIVGDGSGALNTVVDSGTLTAVTSITNVVHVDDNSSTLSIDDGAGSITVDAPAATPVAVRIYDGSSVSYDSTSYDATATAKRVLVVGSTGAVGGAPAITLAAPTKISNAAANGTTTVTPAAGTYRVAVSADEDVWCSTSSGATAADTYFPKNTVEVYRLANVALYCYSAGATGDVYFSLLTY